MSDSGRCFNCGKTKGLHKANTFHCPLPGRSRNFKLFDHVNTYLPKGDAKMAIREKAKSPTEDVKELRSKVTRNMDKSIKSPRSLLIIRHCTDGEPVFYFIQNVEELPINLRKAIFKLHGFVLNVSDWTPPLEKAWAYVSAAFTQDIKYLDKSNAHDANRFAQKLLPYMLAHGNDPFALNPSLAGLDVVSFGECL